MHLRRCAQAATRPAGGLLALLLALAPAAHAFDLQGHRGARGLWPENTLAGFERALALGVGTLEMDTAVTADGVVVVSHDPRLNPDLVRDDTGQWLADPPVIHHISLAQLRRYDVGRIRPGSRYAQQFVQQQAVDGQRVPTLAEVFALVQRLGADSVRFNIETKLDPRQPERSPTPQAFVDALLAVIRANSMSSRVMVQSFDWRTLRILRQQAPEIRTVFLSAQLPRFDTIDGGLWTAGLTLAEHGSVPAMVHAAGGHVWSPHFSDLTPGLLREASGWG